MKKDEALRLLHDPNLIRPQSLILLSNIADLAASLKVPCYIVGGFVRDLILKRPVHDADYDIVVEGDALTLGHALVKTYGGHLTEHPKFRTAIWHLPSTFNFQPSTIDLITARKESYETPGALPTVEPSVIADDLRRRDFPVNAMALRLDGEHLGELLDPLGGQADLEKKTLRVLHPRSFIDDPTRIFRAVRYAARYGFNIEAQTLDLVNEEALKILHSLSGERLRHELDLILDEESAPQALTHLADLGVLTAIHPKLPAFDSSCADWLDDANERLGVQADRRTMGYMFWFMELSEADVILLANRLNFTNELTLDVWSAAQLFNGLPHLTNMKPSEWTYTLEKLSPISIYAVYLTTQENALLRYLSFWRHVKPHVSGADLKSRGLPPGPRYGEILSRLRSAWLDGEASSKEDEAALLERLLKE
ncbi:MAG: hypothetical protein LC099_05390 [Anaerolineales bacterium]|nr:hypothetical protein [Anaerolineales bacterium]